MKFWWFGHSSFAIEDDGIFLVTDPFDKSVGYPIPNVKPTHVTESHQHFDHNAHNLLRGNFEVIKEPGIYNFGALQIEGIPSYHDEEKGAKRGPNIIFKMKFPSSVAVVHFGDLGHMIDENTIKKLENVDVVMIPVGGIFTIDAKKATEIVNRLKPHLVFPMHYMTKYVSFELGKLENFTSSFKDVSSVKGPFEVNLEDIRKFDRKVVIFEM